MTTLHWAPPIELRGKHVSLVPLSAGHADALAQVSAEGDLSRLWYTSVPAPGDMAAEIERRLARRATGEMLPFAVLDPAGRPVGMTSYAQMVPAIRRLEIGWTWYGRHVQRTGLNTEAKRLLLCHAFETLECVAVELRTHFMNQQSRRAIERLGAKLDGVLRSHSHASDGTLRDTCVYSITATEWPAVRSHLDWQLVKPR